MSLFYLNPLPLLSTPDFLHVTPKFLVHPDDAVEFSNRFKKLSMDVFPLANWRLPYSLADVLFVAEAPKGHPILIKQQGITRFTLPSVSWTRVMQAQRDLAE